MGSPQWDTVGRRVATRRERLGLSIRQVASSAKVDKNTILRLEQGRPVRTGSASKICKALGTALERQMLPTSEPEDMYKVSRSSKRAWTSASAGSAPNGSAARWQLGWAKIDASFCEMIDCELFAGTMTPALAEIFAATKPKSHTGEEFVFCLRGQLIVHVGKESVHLGPGDAITFRATNTHWFSPGQPVEPGQPPPMFLSVMVA